MSNCSTSWHILCTLKLWYVINKKKKDYNFCLKNLETDLPMLGSSCFTALFTLDEIKRHNTKPQDSQTLKKQSEQSQIF